MDIRERSRERDGRRRSLSPQIAVALPPAAFAVAAGILAVRLGIGSAREPGPGLWPFIGAVVAFVFAVVSTFQPYDGEQAPRLSEIRRLVAGVAAFALFLVLLRPFGLFTAAAVFAPLLMAVLGERSWRVLLITSLALAAGVHGLFLVALGVPLPTIF